MSPEPADQRSVSGPPRVPRRPDWGAPEPASPPPAPFGLANPFIRELFRSLLIGFAAAGVFVAAILATDLARLRSLALGSEAGILALVMLFILCGLTFASAQTAFSVLMRAKGDEPDDPADAPPR